MAKKALLTIDGKYRKIKNGYITLDNTYHKLRKAYTTIGGVYRPCWNDAELSYYGTITPLSVARPNLAATSIDDKYALFVGNSSVADIYDPSLSRIVKSLQTSVTTVGTSVRGRAIFGGGTKSNGYTDEVFSFNSSLVLSYPSNKLSHAIGAHASASVGEEYALFAGGGYKSPSTYSSYYQSTVDAYDSSLTTIICPSLTNAKSNLSGVSFREYALFAGGEATTYNPTQYGFFSDVEAFSPTLTKLSLSELTVPRMEMYSASIGDKYVLFAGGWFSEDGSYERYSTVDVYDASLTKVSAANIAELSVGRNSGASVSYDICAMFAGGRSNIALNTVEVYDTSLTKTFNTNLSCARYALAAAKIGDYALFAGGIDRINLNKVYDIVDAYLLPEID